MEAMPDVCLGKPGQNRRFLAGFMLLLAGFMLLLEVLQVNIYLTLARKNS